MVTAEKRGPEHRSELTEMVCYCEEGGGDLVKGQGRILRVQCVISSGNWMIEVELKERRNIFSQEHVL